MFISDFPQSFHDLKTLELHTTGLGITVHACGCECVCVFCPSLYVYNPPCVKKLDDWHTHTHVHVCACVMLIAWFICWNSFVTECSVDFQVLKAVKQILATSVSLIVGLYCMNIMWWSFLKILKQLLLKIRDKIFCSAYNFIFINHIQNKWLELCYIWNPLHLEVKYPVTLLAII